MKLPKIIRPDIEIEFIGIKGFFVALYAVFKVGIKKAHIDCTIKTYLRGNAGIVKRYYFYVVPKYKFKRVNKINNTESEVTE